MFSMQNFANHMSKFHMWLFYQSHTNTMRAKKTQLTQKITSCQKCKWNFLSLSKKNFQLGFRVAITQQHCPKAGSSSAVRTTTATCRSWPTNSIPTTKTQDKPHHPPSCSMPYCNTCLDYTLLPPHFDTPTQQGHTVQRTTKTFHTNLNRTQSLPT